MFGALLAGEAQAEALLAELIAGLGSDPLSIDRRELSYMDTCRVQAELSVAYNLTESSAQGERPRQGYRFTTSEFFDRPLPSGAIKALLDVFTADRLAAQSREIYFAPWGGAYNRQPSDITAFAHRDQLFLIEHEASVDPAAGESEKHAAHEWKRRSRDTVRSWGSGRVYPALPDPDLPDWERTYYGDNAARIREIKAYYDPDDRFRATQTISLP